MSVPFPTPQQRVEDGVIDWPATAALTPGPSRRRLRRPGPRTSVIAALVVVVLAGLGTLSFMLVRTHQDLDSTKRVLASTRTTLASTRTELSSALATERQTQDTLDKTREDLRRTEDELNNTRAQLNSARTDASTAHARSDKAVRVATALHACLEGLGDVAKAALDDDLYTVQSILTDSFVARCQRANSGLDELLNGGDSSTT